MRKSREGKNNPNFKYDISKEYLLREYVYNKQSIERIANKLKCSIGPVRRCLKIYNIKARNMNLACKVGNTGKYKRTEEHKNKTRISTIKRFSNIQERNKYSRLFKGKGNPNWRNGLSILPYSGFTKIIKNLVRKRDKYICKNCGLSEKESLKIYNRKLEIHHIDYNKKNSDINNLISLCKQCHSRSNFNRNKWAKKLLNILKGGE